MTIKKLILIFSVAAFSLAAAIFGTNPAMAATTLLQINSGAGTSVAGWAVDNAFSGGITSSNTGGAIDTSKTSNPAPADIYKSGRYDNFSYVLRGLTPNTNYQLRLHFAEFYYSSPGQRVFNVVANNNTILSNFDIISAAGGKNIALTKTFTIKSTSTGRITVAFNNVVNNSKVSGIELSTIDSTPQPSSSVTLYDRSKKEIAMQLVSSAENSTLDWRSAYKYIEDIGDGRGYTGGIIGFCSGTGDMLQLVQYYTSLKSNNILAKYIPNMQKIMAAPYSQRASLSHSLLGDAFVTDWRTAANDAAFQQAQDHERDSEYFNPAVDQALKDRVGVLGQFIYYDAMVQHGPGSDWLSFGGIRSAAMAKAKTPAQGGNETTYLNAFLDARRVALQSGWGNSDRVDTEQRVFLNNGNLSLAPPLYWSVYGDKYSILK